MSETLLNSAKFSVVRRRFEAPGGREVTRDVIVHPGAVAILPWLDEASIVLIHNYRYTVGRELIEVPAGTLEPDEAPAACAARELEEETGYAAGRIEPFGVFYTTPGITDELMHCFVARDLRRTTQRLEGGERIRTEVVPFSTAMDWVRQGRIIDAKTVAILTRFALERSRS